MLATAGSVLKRSYLREQDVPAVVSSRSLEFGEHFGCSKKAQPTIILNSLTSPGTPDLTQAMQGVMLVRLPDWGHITDWIATSVGFCVQLFVSPEKHCILCSQSRIVAHTNSAAFPFEP